MIPGSPSSKAWGIRLVGFNGVRKVNENEAYSKGKRSHIPPGDKEHHLQYCFFKGDMWVFVGRYVFLMKFYKKVAINFQNFAKPKEFVGELDGENMTSQFIQSLRIVWTYTAGVFFGPQTGHFWGVRILGEEQHLFYPNSLDAPNKQTSSGSGVTKSAVALAMMVCLAAPMWQSAVRTLGLVLSEFGWFHHGCVE